MVNFITDDTVLPTFRIEDKGGGGNIKQLWRRITSSDNTPTQSLNQKGNNYAKGLSEPINQSSSDVLLKSMKPKQPQHNIEFGGSRSSFVPVRVPSNDVVGKIDYEKKLDMARIKWKYGNLMKNNDDNLKFDHLMQSLKAREHRELNLIERNETDDVEYKFRPIVPDDEKYQVLLHHQTKAKEVDFHTSNIIRKMPLVEVCFRDDESFDSLSSMGYDGDEHDLDAIFKDEMYETEYSLEDENYFEGKLLIIGFLFFDGFSVL